MIPTPGMQQDTIMFNKFLIKESVRNTFSLPAIRQFTLKDTVKHTLPTATKAIIPSPADTTFVCERNIIADVTFYDPNNAVFIIA